MDMMNKFFKKVDSTMSRREELRGEKYRFRGHAEKDFWRWVCSWSRAIREPSDLGFDNGAFVLPDFDNGAFVLPDLITREHVVSAQTRKDGWLFDMPAIGLQEQREERRRTIKERCEMAATLAMDDSGPVVSWCHLNDEGDMLQSMIDGSVQVSGKDSDEKKVEVFDAFRSGQIQRIITKPKIAGFGMNWQHCARQTFFPSHSFEQWYQSIRRSWRFGQTKPVIIDVITSEGEMGVLKNMQRKQVLADAMFKNLVAMMNHGLNVKAKPYGNKQEEVPSWL
jgi:hypothetical protein